MDNGLQNTSSFKDTSGFIFQKDGKYYRQVNKSYASDYELLISSGIYETLTSKNLLIPHTEETYNQIQSNDGYKILSPEQIPFISYPYEWCFEQLKDASLLTLRICKLAVRKGMILKDASPFNVQFHKGKPVFIDTLSFEIYDPAKPWIAYRQFCESFLFPLLLNHYLGIDAQKWLSLYLEGIPVDITAKLLPFRSRFNLGAFLHVFLQNMVLKKHGKQDLQSETFSQAKLLRILNHLESVVRKMRVKSSIRSEWNHYYRETILSQAYLNQKESLLKTLTSDIQNNMVLDLGCNDGYFSKIMSKCSQSVIAADFDCQCINRLYFSIKQDGISNILPLIIDITNPTPAIGFMNNERMAFLQRIHVDIVLALALIHHLVLGKNIPLPFIARQFSQLSARWLIIEFVPLEDEKVKLIIANKTSYQEPYNSIAFEDNFNVYFVIEKKLIVPGTERILYRMKKR